MKDLVWYASYGSNIYQRRLQLYIQGGEISGLTRMHEGSRDHTMPVKNDFIEVPFATYFSQQVDFWEGKGVAFMDHNINSGTSVSRIYLVTKDQFIDIFAQENGQSPSTFNKELRFNLEIGESNNIGVDDELTWYGKMLCIGEKEGFPIYTFTTKSNEFHDSPQAPGTNYLGVIARGLLDSGMSEKEIKTYLMNLSPLDESYSRSLDGSISMAQSLE